ncbi:MAG: class I SAM-dependent methyltransferase [Sedimentisphaerales bacterium]|nr:class I SAM-dependent methyltransferase [Sedimentisphaerales bacterium]
MINTTLETGGVIFCGGVKSFSVEKDMKFAGMDKYLQSCKSEFWKNVFKAELDYILHQLKGAKDVLSVGCGPAIIETGLAEHGFNVTGLDISKEALGQVPDGIRTVVGSAENMEFAAESFDAVIYVASLQFIEKYKEAVKETARVLKLGGKGLVMLLNPESEFFKEKRQNTDSYVNMIKHTDLKKIERVVAKYFFIETEYFLGIKGTEIFQSRDSNVASLYIIKGTKKQYG